MKTDTKLKERIVVGVDGSDGSRAALEFAMDEAQRRGCGVRVVWAIPETGYWAAAYGMTPPLVRALGRDLEKAGQEMVDSVVADREARAAVPVEVCAVPGPAAAVLIGQAAEADLLVVGHRGLGGLRSAVLGSVGLQCILHAPGPVTVIPHPDAHAHG
jgi:nucleotide-binding universal stress UspA family protein